MFPPSVWTVFLLPAGTRKGKPGWSHSLGSNTDSNTLYSSIFNPALVLIKSKSYALPSVFHMWACLLHIEFVSNIYCGLCANANSFHHSGSKTPEICVRSSERSCCTLVLLIGSGWESETGPSCWGCLFFFFFMFLCSDVYRKEWEERRSEASKQREDGEKNRTGEGRDSSVVSKA